MIWIKIKSKLLLSYRSILLFLGLKNVLLKNTYGERILVFHGIDRIGETRFNSRFFSKAYFEKFIDYISTHYNIISLNDYYDKKFKLNTLNIALTFDDGYLNNFKYALPILEKYNIPASFYITSIHEKAEYLFPDFIDLIRFHTKKKELVFQQHIYRKNRKNEFVWNGNSLKNMARTLPYESLEVLYKTLQEDWYELPPESLEDYWKLMTPEALKMIAKHPLFTIWAHGETHASLIDIPFAQAKNEILNSKQILESICEQPVDEFAFPFGFYSKELADYCLEIGYKKVLLVDYNKDETRRNVALKNRFVMNPYISLDLQLVCLLKGSYY